MRSTAIAGFRSAAAAGTRQSKFYVQFCVPDDFTADAFCEHFGSTIACACTPDTATSGFRVWYALYLSSPCPSSVERILRYKGSEYGCRMLGRDGNPKAT